MTDTRETEPVTELERNIDRHVSRLSTLTCLPRVVRTDRLLAAADACSLDEDHQLAGQPSWHNKPIGEMTDAERDEWEDSLVTAGLEPAAVDYPKPPGVDAVWYDHASRSVLERSADGAVSRLSLRNGLLHRTPVR